LARRHAALVAQSRRATADTEADYVAIGKAHDVTVAKIADSLEAIVAGLANVADPVIADFADSLDAIVAGLADALDLMPLGLANAFDSLVASFADSLDLVRVTRFSACLGAGLNPGLAASHPLASASFEPCLGLGLGVIAAASLRFRLPAMASATALLCLCVAVATAVSARFRSRGRANREGGYTCGQKEPGHDKNSKCFACINEGRGGSVPAAKRASSALGSTLAQ
jgi:hypothetical protein